MFVFISWAMLLSAIVIVSAIPFVGPVAVTGMVLMRWYWTLLARPRHQSSLRWHLPYMTLGPLAIAGSLVLSTLLPHILKALGQDVPFLQEYEVNWMLIALPLAAKIISLYAVVHELINKTFNIQFRWLPENWWDISLYRDAFKLPELFNQSWGTGLMIVAFVYIVLSFFNHLHMSIAARSEVRRLKTLDINGLDEVKREQEMIVARGVPRMTKSKSSAHEF